ncbi:hypothetical protein [Megamonas hypermegale]|uniref:hypothetical protein n=1 Tax=Megamonas hypermegale TaxID=158847 RepID=UPI0026EE3BA0|nr:hypothetical protein [Megamonas hypermegale]
MKLLENVTLDKIDVNKIELVIKQQNGCLLEMYKLLLYDETTDKPDNNKWAKAFLETQIKALEHIGNVLEKHREHFEPKKKEPAKKQNKHDDDVDDIDEAEQANLFE